MPDTSADAPVIHVSAVVITDTDGRILTVRKRGTSTFMLPGGKFESGESPVDAAVRESAEEVGVIVADASLELLGHFRADAANEPDHVVDAHVYVVAGRFDAAVVLAGVPVSEIDEVRWLDLRHDDAGVPLAPLLTDRVWPALTDRGSATPL
ncbi:NUDIX hydrolase [Williamsia phyllosphaerae]|uniref:MutT/NUDIX family protein n=1 Tax=Williamsia phyllosphaerae TaxID=885042 RepID=A0ABQ1UJL9_9NOCA|nr:NUDIX domain-containing protein [Williamsia phyllosphaerae]GGF18466.1 MutT/NUDIX family protein [Williamsia phyllosphaerae]